MTLGSEGVIFYKNDIFYRSKSYNVIVKDKVGAGDTFLATLISGLLNNKTPQEALNIASAFGALVASKDGANPIIQVIEVQTIIIS